MSRGAAGGAVVAASAFYIIGAPFVVQTTTSFVEVAPGGTATYPLTLQPSGVTTIPVAVSFTASSLPSGATATFSPNPVAAGASGNTAVTLTVQTSGSSAQVNSERGIWAVAVCALIVPFAGTCRSGKRIRRSIPYARYLFALDLPCTMSGGLAGCGKLGELVGSAPSSHTYTITVTATGGGTTFTANVLLKVQG